MLIYPNYETQYLIELIKSAIRNEKTPVAEKPIDTERLFSIAKKQQIYNAILFKLEDSGILSAEELQDWKNYYFSELQKIITINSEREKICAQLDENEIKYMYLKGLEIQKYYPKSIMRQMSDNDIIYDSDKRDLLLKIMKKNGYYLGAADGYGDDFHKKPFCTFEFHRTLFSDQDEFHPDFNPWINAAKCENSSRYIMSREDNYIYTISHLYKHYYCQHGCGIRFFCDIYLLTHSKDVFDWDYINNTLDRFGILEFNKLALKLTETLFDGGQADDEQQDLINIIFGSGIYGKGHDKVKEGIDKNNGSKLRYIISRVFPSKEIMVGNYKSLEKHIYLLPFYYIYRLFEKAYHNGDILRDELKKLKKYKNN